MPPGGAPSGAAASPAQSRARSKGRTFGPRGQEGPVRGGSTPGNAEPERPLYPCRFGSAPSDSHKLCALGLASSSPAQGPPKTQKGAPRPPQGGLGALGRPRFASFQDGAIGPGPAWQVSGFFWNFAFPLGRGPRSNARASGTSHASCERGREIIPLQSSFLRGSRSAGCWQATLSLSTWSLGPQSNLGLIGGSS